MKEMGNEDKGKKDESPFPGFPDTGAGDPKEVKKDCGQRRGLGISVKAGDVCSDDVGNVRSDLWHYPHAEQ